MFNVHVDDDEQTKDLFLFLFRYGFLPINLTVVENAKRAELNPFQEAIKSVVYAVADKVGIPTLAQTFAQHLGTALYDLVIPPVVEYALPSALVNLIKSARDTVIEEEGGYEWRTESKER